MLLRTACTGLLLALAACAPAPAQQEDAGERVEDIRRLLDVGSVIQDGWMEFPLRGITEYRIAVVDERIAIRATGTSSASGLVRFIHTDPTLCPTMSWSWRVDTLQKNADLRVKEKEDVAASIFLIFGDPGFFGDTQPVPTLRYVWTNDEIPVESVIDNPYVPGIVRSIVLESGEENLGRWTIERRNVLEDYAAAFGQPPRDEIHAIAIFTDNDQTKQPVTAYYEWIRAICR